MSRAVIIIPARKGSTRFPNKPMALINGKHLLFRTWQIAKSVANVAEVYIATDDEDIQRFAEGFGAEVIMTRPECENGTVRSFEAVSSLSATPEIVVNLQGDAVLTPPWVIQATIDEVRSDPAVAIATPAIKLSWEKYDDFVRLKSGAKVSGTMVVFNENRDALYFSKGFIPFVSERTESEPPLYRHIGLYCYRFEALAKYVTLKPTSLERLETLEQLRALENNIPIRVVPVDYRGRSHWSIDNPADVAIAEEIISREGELV